MNVKMSQSPLRVQWYDVFSGMERQNSLGRSNACRKVWSTELYDNRSSSAEIFFASQFVILLHRVFMLEKAELGRYLGPHRNIDYSGPLSMRLTQSHYFLHVLNNSSGPWPQDNRASRALWIFHRLWNWTLNFTRNENWDFLRVSRLKIAESAWSAPAS